MISIIMPAYNAEQYIGEAINSVLKQSITDWELIVVDDGSSDKTADVVLAFDDLRIRYFRQSNRGVSAARNLGIAKARGEYLTFLDADDALSPECLKVQTEYLERYPDIDMVQGAVSIRDERLYAEQESFHPFCRDDLPSDLLRLDGTLWFTPGYMLRRDRIGTLRFQEGMTHAEDILFMMRLVLSGLRYGCIQETTYLYRRNTGSAINNMDGWRQGYLDLLKWIGKDGLVPYIRTIPMRLKIAKMLLSWQVRQGNPAGITDLFRVW